MITASPLPDATRHQTWRARGLPTVTTLVGPVTLGARAWRAWAEADGWPCAVVAPTDPGAALSGWVSAAFAAARPRDRALAWLVATMGRTPDTATRDVERMTRYDLDGLRRSLPVDPHGPGATAAFLVLDAHAAGAATDPTRFVTSLGAGPDRVVRAVAELYPPALWPALLLTPPAEGAPNWALSAVRLLERVAVAEPRVPVAVALTAHDYDCLLARYPDTRAVALLREGFVELRTVSGNQLEGRLRAAGAEPVPATVERLTATGLAEDVAEAFVAAVRAMRDPSPADVASDFRSVHEEFLFNQLESMPPTAGLFRPNHPLPFRHGPQTAEGDLVAESLRLAVEVDGGFYHLNPDQYRRDRRKDWLYQQEGYWVLRFLAEDVVNELEDVLNTILEAVALRRTSAPPTGAA